MERMEGCYHHVKELDFSLINYKETGFLVYHINRYEVARPLSSDLKRDRHISCPFGSVGRGRAHMVTYGSNLPRHGPEKARKYAGRTQSGGLAKAAGRSIKRMVQPRDYNLDGDSWESPGEG